MTTLDDLLKYTTNITYSGKAPGRTVQLTGSNLTNVCCYGKRRPTTG